VRWLAGAGSAGHRRHRCLQGPSLSGTVQEPALKRHEWEIACSLREISELLTELASAFAQGSAGPMTTAVVASQNRAITLARQTTETRVVSIELLAAHIAAAEAARRDWETAQQVAARNDKYLDLVARTAADEHVTGELTNLAEQAGQAARLYQETLAQATLAAEALAL
jgi:hypothetical protein